MTPIKLLNYLLFVENILGVHRKYNIQNKIKKYLIIFQIVIQTTFHAITLISEIYLLFKEEKWKNYIDINVIKSCYAVTAHINAISAVLTGICYSQSFLSYLDSITRVSDSFQDDRKLAKSLKKMYYLSISLMFLSISFVMYRVKEYLKRFSYMHPLIVVPVVVSQFFIRSTLIVQPLILFTIIMIVAHLFRSFNYFISVVNKRARSVDSLSEENDITREEIQNWVELYRDLENSCENVAIFFGHQYFFTLTMSISNSIMMVYHVGCSVLLKAITPDLRRMVIGLLNYVAWSMLPVISGQVVRNQAVKCHREFARLYNTVVIDPSEEKGKLIKDFIRVIKKKPLDIKLLSKLPIGMYMLPAMLTMGVNYAIMVLQINHII
ncbi:hypothetical protein B5X24_HaOG200759 [Helicoverpa armigera]|nr:hypothetical protein B5X24_HaOG200759 [Helicoverpa armigera]